MRRGHFACIFFVVCFSLSTATCAATACRQVQDDPKISIDPATQKALADMHVTRALAFAILRRTAVPETHGCWADATGSFDGQIVSVGALQWNFGQGTLQFLLFQYRKRFLTDEAFEQELGRLMPKFGALLFSEDCKHASLSRKCKSVMLTHQANGRLTDDLASELNALFESDTMIQVQVDRYLSILTSVGSDLKRLFGDKVPSEIQVKWALDTKVQQGSFPKDKNVNLMRKNLAKLSIAGRQSEAMGLIKWYDGLCTNPFMQGVRLDCSYNIPVWSQQIRSLYSPRISQDESQKFDLLNLTWLKAIETQGEGGAYQALTFQRRVTIVLERGSLAGNRL